MTYIKPENTFVLENWGTFLLKEINNKQTRLIIRTQEAGASNQWLKIANYIDVPLHFIMERRALMGIKARAENSQLSQNKDILWFSAIVLSGFLICFLVLIGRGIIQSIIISFVFSTLWLCSIFLFNPIPLYSVGLLLIICLAIARVTQIKLTNRIL